MTIKTYIDPDNIVKEVRIQTEVSEIKLLVNVDISQALAAAFTAGRAGEHLAILTYDANGIQSNFPKTENE